MTWRGCVFCWSRDAGSGPAKVITEMQGEYPGQYAREKCARRTREELAAMPFTRDPVGREQVRLAWMADRCGQCGACPMTLRALAVMLPKPEPESNVVEFRLAG